MIRLSNLSLYYADRALLKSVNFSISHGEKVAITGRNGSGKSTLFKIITRQVRPDEGTVETPNEYVIGYLKQELPPDSGLTVKDEVKMSLSELKKLNDELDDIEFKLTNVNLSEQELIEYLDRQEFIHNRLSYLQADKLDGEIERILFGLGFKNTDLMRRASEFSGGWRMRIELAKLLISKPDALLLDEPNNHLDILSILWLEKYLKAYEGTVLLISHDIQFLDSIAKRILEIDRGKLYDFTGTYTNYKNYRAERLEIETNEFNAQQKVIQHKEALIDKFRAKANKASFAKSLQKELERMDVKEIPDEDTSQIRLRFQPSNPGGRKVAEIRNLSKRYGELNVLNNVELLIERGEKLSFVGQNGNGKSTLVKLICDEIQAEEGNIEHGHQIKIAYFAQEHTNILDPQMTILQTLEQNAIPSMRTNIRNILGGLGFHGDDVDKRIQVLSGGEKSRVRLANLLVQEHNFLILDEPTHHLDVPSKNSLKDAIKNYHGTVIVVSHDREFLRDLAEKTISFENKTIKEYLGDIDYYLEKKEQEGSETIYSTANNTKLQTENPTKDNKEDKKKTARQLQYVERDIEKLEADIKSIENIMAEESFYTRKDQQKILNDYQDLKSKLTKKTEEWETLMN